MATTYDTTRRLPTATSTVQPRTTAQPLPGATPNATVNPIDPANDFRFKSITPTTSPRLAGTQTAVNQAAGSITGGPSRSQLGTDATQRFSNLFGTGQVTAPGVGTSVNAGAVNPNVGFRSVGTNVAFQGRDPNVGFRSVNPNVAGGPSVMPMESDRYRALGGQQDQAVSNLTTGPNRTELAKATLADLFKENEIQRRRETQGIGRSAATLGRIGSGMVNTDLLDLESEIERQRTGAATQLAREVSEGDIADRYRTVDTLSGLRGQEYGLDSATRGEQRTERDYSTGLGERNVARAVGERDTELGLSERNLGRGMEQDALSMALAERNLAREAGERDTETGLSERNVGRQFADRDFTTGLSERNLARGTDERNFQTGLGERNADRAFDRTRTAASLGMQEADASVSDRYRNLDALMGLEGQQYGQGLSERGELRGERDFQVGLDRQAQEDEVQRLLLEEQLLQSGFNRDLATSEFDARYNPGAAQLGVAGEHTNAGASTADSIAEYLAELERRRREQQGLPSTGQTAETTRAV